MNVEKKDIGTETNPVSLESVGVNTTEVEIETFENSVEVDVNGQIHPRRNEIIVEMKVKLGIKHWQEIEAHIVDDLQLTLLGKPWLSNSGNHFMTVGFRTKCQDFENWKIRTLNWQDSGIRAVSFSRLYK